MDRLLHELALFFYLFPQGLDFMSLGPSRGLEARTVESRVGLKILSRRSCELEVEVYTVFLWRVFSEICGFFCFLWIQFRFEGRFVGTAEVLARAGILG